LFNAEHVTPRVLSPVHFPPKDYFILQFKALMPSLKDLEVFLPIYDSIFLLLNIILSLAAARYYTKRYVIPFLKSFSSKQEIKIAIHKN
jgi:hypothetical protein